MDRLSGLAHEFGNQFVGLLHPHHEYQHQARMIILVLLGSLPIRLSLVVQECSYGFIWTGLLLCITAGWFIFPCQEFPKFLCDRFKTDWTDLHRFAYAYCLLMQFLTVNTLGTVLDYFSINFKAFLILMNLHELNNLHNWTLHDLLALIIMVFASAEVVTPLVGQLVSRTVIPMEQQVEYLIVLASAVASGLIGMYVWLRGDERFRRLQRRFVWAGLWAQLTLSCLSDQLSTGFEIVSITMLISAFCSMLF